MKKTVIVLVSALIMLSNTTSANAQKAWDTLPDGRVVIEVFGERLAFDPKDRDIVNDEPATDRGSAAYFEITDKNNNLVWMSLKEVIRSRVIAEEFFNIAKNKFERVRFTFNFFRNSLPEPITKTQSEGVFLGKIPYSEIKARSELTFSIAPQQLAGYEEIVRANIPPAPPFTIMKGPDEFGMFSYVPESRGEEGVPGKPYISETLYSIPKTRRLTSTEFDMLITCGNFEVCSMFHSNVSGKVGISYKWGSDILPKSKWIKLDDTLRHLAAYIFIDRKAEDFQ